MDILVEVFYWVILLDVGDDDPITAVFVPCVHSLFCTHLGLRVVVCEEPSPLAVGDQASFNGFPEANLAADVQGLHLALVEPHLNASSVTIEGPFLDLTLHHVCQVIIIGGLVFPKVYDSSNTSE